MQNIQLNLKEKCSVSQFSRLGTRIVRMSSFSTVLGGVTAPTLHRYGLKWIINSATCYIIFLSISHENLITDCVSGIWDISFFAQAISLILKREKCFISANYKISSNENKSLSHFSLIRLLETRPCQQPLFQNGEVFRGGSRESF